MNPWDRQPGESEPAWEAFAAYRDMGPGERSLSAVAQMFNKSRTLMGRWSARWGWPFRAEAFDRHMDATAQEAREHAIQAEAAVWARRRAEVREAEWEAAEALRAKADEILALSLDAQKFNLADAARLHKTASELARLAAEMPTRPAGADADAAPEVKPEVAEAAIAAALAAAALTKASKR